MFRLMQAVHLFHLHFYAPDPQTVEQAFVEHLGMNVVARYGIIGSEQVRFPEDTGWDAIAQAGARFRLTQLANGTFDLVLGLGKRSNPTLEHFGLLVDPATF